jgi:hypothetical protein
MVPRIIWIAGVVLTLSGALPAQQKIPDGYIEIDGAKTPELIPEHVMWSTGFDTIAFLTAKGITQEGPLAALVLAQRDRELLLAEVARYKERREACHTRGARIAAAMDGQAVEKIEAAMRANTLACRTTMLESKDRLLLDMSPEGGVSLTTWMLNERRKLRSVMPKTELEFYRLPR